ncbi:MAG: ATP phosphoribosyltransferase regulatory subunit [Blastocatellia bacterium]|jgi:ATP phosphoribosyltransferase regulatory subunit
MSSLTKIPSGVQYFFDEEVRRRRYVEATALTVFNGWSYDEIILPMFDYQDLFSRGMGIEKAERTYRFVDRDGSLLALRPELTSLVARTVATRFTRKPRPIRLCYSGEVFRYDEPTQRAAREFHQLGIEHIGQSGIAADLEVLLIATEVLTKLGLNNFRITLSHVDFFNGIATHLGLDQSQKSRLRELLDRRDSQNLDRFLETVAPGIETDRRRGFCRLIQLPGGEESLIEAEKLLINEQSRDSVSHLKEIHSALQRLGLTEAFAIDLGEAANLDYYTGLTFRIYVPEWGTEIGSGGRYDRLIGNFGAAEPAVGFSLSLDGLAGALANQNHDQPWQSIELPEGVDYQGQLAETFSRARELRNQNKKVKIGADQ